MVFLIWCIVILAPKFKIMQCKAKKEPIFFSFSDKKIIEIIVVFYIWMNMMSYFK